MTGVAQNPGHPPEIADLIEQAVLKVPGVTSLHGGLFGEVATYLPGRRVSGVRVRDDLSEVHVVIAWGTPVLGTATAVCRVVQALVGTPVDVTIEDIIDSTLSESSNNSEETP